MIAEAVYLAVAGLDFCHAAGRSIFSNRLRIGVASLVSQTWLRQRLRSQRRNCYTPIKNS
jgi:hypothetical protein